jgi:hypothetical protein
VIGAEPVDRDHEQQRSLHRLLGGGPTREREHGQRQDQPQREPDPPTALRYHGGDSI